MNWKTRMLEKIIEFLQKTLKREGDNLKWVSAKVQPNGDVITTDAR